MMFPLSEYPSFFYIKESCKRTYQQLVSVVQTDNSMLAISLIINLFSQVFPILNPFQKSLDP